MVDYNSIDIFTIEPVEIIRKKNKTKNTLGATLTLLIPFVIVFFFIYLFLTNQMKPDIVSDNLYYTKDLKSPVDFRIEFNYDFVKNDSIAWFEMVTDDVKQTDCYMNKSSTNHNRDEVKLCDYSTDSIGENNGVGFVFKMDVEDSYKTFLNADEIELPFYLNPTEDIVYITKQLKKQLCQFFLNTSKSICYPYNLLINGNYKTFINDNTGNTHLHIYDISQSYYFINDILVDSYIYNQTSNLYRVEHYKNDLTYYIYKRNPKEQYYSEIYQNTTLILRCDVPYNTTYINLNSNIYQYYYSSENHIIYDSPDINDFNKHNIYIINVITNNTFSYTITKDKDDEFNFRSIPVKDYLFFYTYVLNYGFNVTVINLIDYSITNVLINIDTNKSIFYKSYIYNTMSNVFALTVYYTDKSTVSYFIDTDLKIDIIKDVLNHPYFDQPIFNYYKLDNDTYRFFGTNRMYPKTFNNWKTLTDLSHICDCKIINTHYFNCSSKYINYLQSNIHHNYTDISNIRVATMYTQTNEKIDIFVKDVIPRWNQDTKTMYSNVITMDYNNEKITISKSESNKTKMLYSTYMNNTELDLSYGITPEHDIWIIDNTKSGHSNKFKCYIFPDIKPDDINFLQNAITCQTKDVYSIPFLLPDRIQLFDSKFYFEYKSNLTSGIILFNLSPTYKVTTYTSTKSPIINILISVVGIISPLIAAFTFVKKFWYKTENKEEINRRDSMNLNESLINIRNNENSDLDLNIELSKIRNISSV
jgi:hypothetical protein